MVSPAEGMRGYWINPLTFTYITAKSVYQEWKKVEKKNTTYAKKIFSNFTLGMPYLGGEGLITRPMLLQSMSMVEGGGGYYVLGCDQGDILHWVIMKVLPTGRMPLISFGTTTDFFYIDKLIDLYQIRAGVIDALPNKHNARDLVQRHKGRMYMAYYRDQREERKHVTENKRRELDKAKRVQEAETQTLHLDRTESLDDSADDWINGRAYLVGDPNKNLSEDQEEFIRQLTNMKRDYEEDTEGNTKAVWIKVGDDHYRHAHNYAKAAMNLYGRGRIEDLHVGGSISNFVLPQQGRVSIGDLVPAGMDLRSTFGGIKGL
jgi:hypothetical protein